MTGNDASVRIANAGEERADVTLTVRTAAGERVYRDAFELPANDAVERPDVASPGHEVAVSVGEFSLDRTVEMRVCRDPLIRAEVGPGDAVAMGQRCRRRW